MATSTAENLFEGALAGFAATTPMSIAMELMHRALPEHEQFPLPPRRIIADSPGGKGNSGGNGGDKAEEGAKLGATMVSHYAFGATAGSIYATQEGKVDLPPVVKGMGYGLGVWAVNYLGLLPAVGLIEPPTKMPARHTALMIAAHVVWGAALGLLTEAARGNGKGS
jgi:uncharacterized membrane protein YagU involved in acid resistance